MLVCIGFPIMLTHIGYHLAGCASGLRTLDDLNDPKDDVTLAECRTEMRAAKEAGADKHKAYDVYTRCVKDGGL